MFNFWTHVPHADILAGVFAMILGAILSFMAIPVIVRVCQAKGLMDKPNGRTSHIGTIPSLGGIAIFAGVFLGSSLLMPFDHLVGPLRYIMAATFILFLTGQKDDIIGLSWKKKFVAEILASLIVIIPGNLRFTTLFGVAGIHEIPEWASILFTLVVFVAIINSFNLIDGIDGLASGTGILTSFVMGSWMYALGEHGMAVVAWSLTGSLIPFFYFNVFGVRNKLFMGDTGSLITGFLMALFAVVICGKEMSPGNLLYMKAAPSVVFAILILPLFDLLRVFTLRIVSGKNPFVADRNHIHHLYLAAGYSHRRSTFYILILNVAAIAFALVFRNSGIIFLGLTLLGASALITLAVRFIGKRRKG